MCVCLCVRDIFKRSLLNHHYHNARSESEIMRVKWLKQKLFASISTISDYFQLSNLRFATSDVV